MLSHSFVGGGGSAGRQEEEGMSFSRSKVTDEIYFVEH